jgi:hypothetical protein
MEETLVVATVALAGKLRCEPSGVGALSARRVPASTLPARNPVDSLIDDRVPTAALRATYPFMAPLLTGRGSPPARRIGGRAVRPSAACRTPWWWPASGPIVGGRGRQLRLQRSALQPVKGGPDVRYGGRCPQQWPSVDSSWQCGGAASRGPIHPCAPVVGARIDSRTTLARSTATLTVDGVPPGRRRHRDPLPRRLRHTRGRRRHEPPAGAGDLDPRRRPPLPCRHDAARGLPATRSRQAARDDDPANGSRRRCGRKPRHRRRHSRRAHRDVRWWQDTRPRCATRRAATTATGTG